MPRYGHKSDPHTHADEILMTASVGLMIFGTSRSSKRTSRGPYRTAPRMIISLFRFLSVSLSACGISAIHRECVPDHEACTRAAKPQNRRGNLLRPTKSTDGLFLSDVFHGFGFLGDHVGNHRCFDCTGAHGIDANASGGIFKRCALRQPDHPVFRCVIDSPARDAYEAADGRIVHDGPTSLFAHLEQLVLHAEEDTAEIDRIHLVELLTGGISSFNGETLHTGVVERGVQPPKYRNCLLDHRLHLSFIGDIAADSNRLMAGSDQALGGYPHCRFIDVNQCDRSTLCCKCLRRSPAHT